jgi:hypothetical protein
MICFIRGIFRSIRYFNLISGHNYIEKYNNEDVSILECETCGHISVGYYNWRE